jgi:hypothetical protein
LQTECACCCCVKLTVKRQRGCACQGLL